MPRWLLWTLSVAAVLGLALTALVLWPAGAPFRFLQGQRAYALDMPGLTSRGAPGAMGIEASYYTFKADYAKLVKEAAKELKAQGYTSIDEVAGAYGDSTEIAMFTKGDMFGGMSAPGGSTSGGSPPMPEVTMVYLMKDLKMSQALINARTQPPFKDKGWVTVIIWGTRPKTPFERFKEWIGLGP